MDLTDKHIAIYRMLKATEDYMPLWHVETKLGKRYGFVTCYPTKSVINIAASLEDEVGEDIRVCDIISMTQDFP